jgi:hypothetical protein
MSQKPIYSGTDSIMQAYDAFIKKAPYYSIWNGRCIINQYNGTGSADDAREELFEMMSACEQGGNTDVFMLKFHPTLTDGYIVEKTPVLNAFPVQPCPSVNKEFRDNSRMPHHAYISMENRLLERMDERLQALETEKGDIDEADGLGRIMGFLEKPAGQALLNQLMPVIAPVIGSIFKGIVPMAAPMTTAVNGTGDTPAKPYDADLDQAGFDLLNDSLDRLSVKMQIPGDVKLLADFAETNPAMFDMLLTQLRAPK